MAEDLGDSHAKSLRQGGALPARSTALRYVGKVFSEANKPVTVHVFPTLPARRLTVGVYSDANKLLHSATGSDGIFLRFIPGATAFYKVKIKNASPSNPAQNVFIKINYTAPRIARTKDFPATASN